MKDIAEKELALGDTVAFAVDNVLVLGAVIRLFKESEVVIISAKGKLYERATSQVVRVKCKKFDSIMEYVFNLDKSKEEINNDIRANESRNRQYINIFPRIYRKSSSHNYAG